MAYGNVNVDTVTTSTAGGVLGAGNASIMKNRIINGAMVIDQRNAGASVTITSVAANQFTVDRWAGFASAASKFSVQQNAGAVTPPAGFTNYLGATSLATTSLGSTDFYFLRHQIEGYNIADFGWGTANAKTITVSFWVRSSLTGTFGGAVRNAANDYSYPFSYSIPVANTWTQIAVTITGPTSGTWQTTSGQGLEVDFSLGMGATYSGTAGSWVAANCASTTGAVSVVGTNGATFYITGVQLEVGSSATGFEYRQYGQELALCQRYYYRLTMGQYTGNGSGLNDSTTASSMVFPFPVTMRTSPSALEQNGVANDYSIRISGSSFVLCSSVPTFATANTQNGAVNFTAASGLTTGQSVFLRASGSAPYLGWSAEL